MPDFVDDLLGSEDEDLPLLELLESDPDEDEELGEDEPCEPCDDEEDEPWERERRLSLLDPGDPTASGCTP